MPFEIKSSPTTTMSDEQALEVEALFGVLANDTRLKLLHQIARDDEICSSDLAAAVSMKP